VQLSGLFIYPVKSLGGIAVSSALLDDLGLVGDRRFMVVDAAGRFLTQRTLPHMALIATALDRDRLTLSNPGHGSMQVQTECPGTPRAVTVWRDTVTTIDCGDEAAAWLSDFLHQSCRLVRIGAGYDRPVQPTKAQPGDHVSLADGYPLLVISEASLADLNARLQARGGRPVPMNRFRPNIVVSGCAAYAEDTWPQLQIGPALFRVASPCARCVITTTDQATAERNVEPLRTLATYRRDPAEPTHLNFGQNLINESKTGILKLGDAVIPGSAIRPSA
jgi:uncharacterized protein YcbX